MTNKQEIKKYIYLIVSVIVFNTFLIWAININIWFILPDSVLFGYFLGYSLAK